MNDGRAKSACLDARADLLVGGPGRALALLSGMGEWTPWQPSLSGQGQQAHTVQARPD